MTQDRLIPEEERRLVTVLFADLVGYTSMSEARDPELIVEALNLCFERFATEIRRYGGYVDKIVGDEIMALFGAPRAQEDDAGKAVAAALVMRDALEELTPQLVSVLGQGFGVRIGVNTGLVVTGAIGPGGYTVTGDAVNVAARLEKAGDPGTITVGETTRRLARRPFEWGERQEISVKGRVESVVCYTAERMITTLLRLVPAPSDTPFVGRDEHVEQIRRLWETAAGGTASVLQLVGEAGIGKTRLLAHIFADLGATPEQVLYTRADTPPRTFGPLMQLLPSLRSDLPAGFEHRIELLSRAHEVEDAPEVEPDWLVDGLADVIRRLAARAPVAMVLDDMHRADRATVEIVEKLLPRLQSLPVMTLLLRQPTGRRVRHLSDAETITLEPLSADQGRALVNSAAPGLRAPTVAEIVSQAGGNPLYLEMMALATAAAPEGKAVPESLQTAVVARVDELDEFSRRVLREASVFGQSFYEEPLKLTTTVSERLYESLEHLCQVGLLDELSDMKQRGYQFRHSLVQQVLYEGLLLRQRVQLHHRAAEALELSREEGLEVEPEQLAFHYQEAGDSERAAAYYLAAAERADHLRAPTEARSHRRAANRLLNVATLAGLYAANGRPSLAVRVGAIAVQALIAAALLLPVFLVMATKRPDPYLLTLGLPFEIIDFNPSSIFLAVVLGGLPLLVAGIVFTHLAVPLVMRRQVPVAALVAIALGGWLLGLVFVVAGYGALLGLLRLGALDRLSSMYVGGATLQLLLGNNSLVWTVLAGTLVVSIAWTALLRQQARGWARVRRSSMGPREIEEGRRWAAVRQLGMLMTAVGVLTVAVVLVYELGLLPNSDVQSGLSVGVLGALVVPFGGMALVGGGAAVGAGRRLRSKAGAYQLGFFGFEVPLVLALAFGLVMWFGMREAVIVSANNVDTPGSLSAYNRAVKMFPDLGMAHYLRGERHLAANDLEAARMDFNRAAELDPNFPATYLARGRVLVGLSAKAGDEAARKTLLNAALADGDRLVGLRPEHPGGYAIRALAKSQLGDAAGALQEVTLATRSLPENARAWDAYFVRCLALAEINRLDEAEADCKKVLELNPGHFVSIDELVYISLTRGKSEEDDVKAKAYFQEGIDYATQELAIDSTQANTWANRGEAYLDIGEYSKGEPDLSRAIELDDSFARAHLQRGLAYVYLDRAAEAVADVDRALELYRRDPEAVRLQGLDVGLLLGTHMFVTFYAGDPRKAVDEATGLIDQGNDTPWVLSTRGMAHLELGELQAGLDDMNRALGKDPGYVLAIERRGYAYLLLGDLVRAKAGLDDAAVRLATLQTKEEQAELHYHRALLLQATQQTVDAQAEITTAANLVDVPSVRRQIEVLQTSLGAPR